MPCPASLLKAPLAIALVAFFAGCPVSPPSATFPCNTNADCAEDNACVDGICRGGKPSPDADAPVRDAGRKDGGGNDAGPRDGGGDAGRDAGAPDASFPPDAGDAGGASDGGGEEDGGGGEGGPLDGGDEEDAGPVDAGEADAGEGDGGEDGGEADGGVPPYPVPAPAHHWPFDDPPDSDTVRDVVGDAHGRAWNTDSVPGALVLDGDEAYVDLPNKVMMSATNATFEVWLRWQEPEAENIAWTRIFDFGSNSMGEVETPGGGFDGANSAYLFLTAKNGYNSQTTFGITLNGADGDQHLDAPRIPHDGSLTHIVVVYDGDNGEAHLYTDGELRSSMTTTIALSQIDYRNNWLGRSNWSHDPYLKAQLEDFRIYHVALTDAEVAASFAAGVP